MRLRSLLTLAGLAVAGSVQASEATPEQIQFFEGKIRPILSTKCYKCHSQEEGKSKGGLVLDTKAGLLKGGDSGPGLKAGNPDASLLIKAVLYTDADLQMPPKGEKLSDAEIADLTTWVKMGAPDPRLKAKGDKLSGLTDSARRHWAYQPLVKPAIPLVKNRAWCATPVDCFIMQGLEEHGMAPSPDTNRDTLLRRATYDLTGLPPSPQEIAAFRADTTPQAFAKVVDRLLASPQYGERWGRFWLDTARYADTTGQRDERGDDYRYPYAWTYRDWVVNAFNKDLPYDQMVLQQLAADKLPNNAPENKAALGFLTVGEKFENNNDNINDRIDVVSKGFMGLTVACARCHDHMFDPIPTKDYYALHGIFSSTVQPAEMPVLNGEKMDPAKKAEFLRLVDAAEQKNRDIYFKLVGDHSAMFRAKAGAYLMAAYYRRNASSAENLKLADSIIKAEKLDVPLMNELRKYVKLNNEFFGPFVECAEAGASIQDSVNGIGNNSANATNPIIAAAFKGAKVKSLADVAQIYTRLLSGMDAEGREILATLAAAKTRDSQLPDEMKTTLLLMPFKVRPAGEFDTETLRDNVQSWPIQLQGKGRFDFAKVNELKITHDGSDARAMVVEDSATPKDSPVFIRGQAEVKGDMVPRRFLEFLSNGKPQPFTDGSGRLGLAQAIVNKSNPLTARVAVNRVWMHHFGQAFVRTPDDLGTQSEAPSHQQLLDYLSWYFMDQGWSFKKLHKLIMLSRVYQESSYTVKAHAQLDPDNRYLWRANIRRLDFESVRDSLLKMSGQLESQIGGQPVNLTDEPYSYRRSVYGYIDRGNLPELMAALDFSDPKMTNSARTTTIVPQQALFLMNSPMAIDVARRVMARPEVATSGADFMKVQAIYEIIYQRMPSKDEIEMAMRFISLEKRRQTEVLAQMKEATAKSQKAATERAANMANKSDAIKAIQNEGSVIERRPLDPWETYAQALLFSNESCYVN